MTEPPSRAWRIVGNIALSIVGARDRVDASVNSQSFRSLEPIETR
jgi:hypothetical protein